MAILTRLVAIISLVLVSLVAFAATTVAFDIRSLAGASFQSGLPGPGANGLPAAGTYKNSNLNASFFTCCGSDGATNLQLFVQDSASVSNPVVGPTTSTDEVDVQFSLTDYLAGLFIGGCIIPDHPSDFTVNSTATSAQLNTTVLATTKTCAGQTLNGLTPPFTLNATWTAASAGRTDTALTRYTCGAYRNESQGTSTGGSNVTATFSASFLTAPLPPIPQANLSSASGSTHAQGTADPGCQQLGGKGAGPGPQAAGDYTTQSTSAAMSIQPDDTSQPSFSVFATSFTNTAHPVRGPVSTQTETDLNIFQFSFFQPVRDCWVIAPGDFTVASDLHTATLNVPITEAPGQCQFATNIGPSVQGISATWVATTPLASFTRTSQGGCGTFHVAGTTAQTSVNASASATWPGIAAEATDANSFIGTNNSVTHVQGTLTGC
jgi:hypothetical protein